jgi:murein DD-endopeptidase MepM/ murein hydrolase activator NlpD
MSGKLIAGRIAVSTAVSVVVVAPPALADDDASGGAAAPERPRVESASCDAADTATCRRGEVLELTGDALDDTRAVVFLGGAGRQDDRRAAPRTRDDHAVTVSVPRDARSGPVRVVSSTGAASRPGPRVAVRGRVAIAGASAGEPLPPPAGAGSEVFPIDGEHAFGKGTANRFGGGRGHQGQDVFARCGTPLVAARDGVVTTAASHSRAGNYVVVTDDAGRSYAYMHMREPALVAEGDRVRAGDPIGEVGQTGRASGCHLHFELWTAPGWHKGGKAIDPLPELRRLDAVS